MRLHRRASLLIAATAAASLAVPAMATADSPRTPTTPAELKASIGARTTTMSATSFGNDVFRVFVEENWGLGVGSLTAQSGPKHPAGAGRNLLFGNGTPGTSYLILRHIDRGSDPRETVLKDYVQGSLLTHPTEQPLDDVLEAIEPIGETGVRLTWDSGTFDMTQDIVVHGTTAADSSVEVTTRITPADVRDGFQLQYLWDVALGADDGPVLQSQTASTQYRPFEPVNTTEQLISATTDSVALADNDQSGAPPTLAVGITTRGPGVVTPAPTAPETQKYVCWPEAIYGRFGAYDPDDSYDISTPSSGCTNSNGKNDSAVLTNWSAEATAGQPITFSASLFAAPRQGHATGIEVADVRLSEPAFTATLTDTGAVRGVAGRSLAFSIGDTADVACRAVTDASGNASCGTTAQGIAALLAGGYTVRYAGDAIWAAAAGES